MSNNHQSHFDIVKKITWRLKSITKTVSNVSRQYYSDDIFCTHKHVHLFSVLLQENVLLWPIFMASRFQFIFLCPFSRSSFSFFVFFFFPLFIICFLCCFCLRLLCFFLFLIFCLPIKNYFQYEIITFNSKKLFTHENY